MTQYWHTTDYITSRYSIWIVRRSLYITARLIDRIDEIEWMGLRNGNRHQSKVRGIGWLTDLDKCRFSPFSFTFPLLISFFSTRSQISVAVIYIDLAIISLQSHFRTFWVSQAISATDPRAINIILNNCSNIPRHFLSLELLLLHTSELTRHNILFQFSCNFLFRNKLKMKHYLSVNILKQRCYRSYFILLPWCSSLFQMYHSFLHFYFFVNCLIRSSISM